jgi:hypothetical protein
MYRSSGNAGDFWFFSRQTPNLFDSMKKGDSGSQDGIAYLRYPGFGFREASCLSGRRLRTAGHSGRSEHRLNPTGNWLFAGPKALHCDHRDVVGLAEMPCGLHNGGGRASGNLLAALESE